MSRIIQVGDVELTRFPENDFAPIERCYDMCRNEGLVVAPADFLVLS